MIAGLSSGPGGGCLPGTMWIIPTSSAGCVSYPHSPSQPHKFPGGCGYDFPYPHPPAPQTMYTLALGGTTEATLNDSNLTSLLALSLISATSATTIGSIQGPTFLSAYNGQTLTNITGLVAAKVRRLIRSPLPPSNPSPRAPPHSGSPARKPMTKPSRLV